MSINAIEVQNLTKTYRLYQSPKDRLRDLISLSGRTFHHEFHALHEVSFTVAKGQTLGIIGQNGSGKSTLLKMICGVLRPTVGRVVADGRIAALLELGAGFNPEFTGRENVYMNGALMGLRRAEMRERFPAIERFAEIGPFIDQPVKTYSSGMFVRLAFAAAIHVDPDILIVDEALSVGDMYFQERCLEKMKEFKKQQKTIVFVSHSLPSIRNFCDVAIWLDKARLIETGEASLLCEKYQAFIRSKVQSRHEDLECATYMSESAEIRSVKINRPNLCTDHDIGVEIEYVLHRPLAEVSLAVSIADESGKLVTLYNTARDEFGPVPAAAGEHMVKLVIPNNDFLSGKYYISVYLGDEIMMITYAKVEHALSYVIQTPRSKNGLPIAEGAFRSKHCWEILQ